MTPSPHTDAEAPCRPVILAVDDQLENLFLLEALLAESYEVRTFTNGPAVLDFLACGQLPDVLLLDVVMPGMDGFDVCRRIKADPAIRDLPVIFLTGLDTPQAETQGLDLGAEDFIHKPFVPAVVMARVRNLLARHQIEQRRQELAVREAQMAEQHRLLERKKAEERINDLAFFDQLTRLPNRPLLLDRLRQAMADSDRSDRYGAVLMLDLDHFKVLNDTRGHAEGDLLLQRVASRLIEAVRTADTVARLGGDEFVVILTGINENSLADAAVQVEGIAQKIVSVLGQSYALPSATFHCSASVGVTLFQGEAISAEDLLKQADMAMYQSKNMGGNSFTFFDRNMEIVALDHARAEADLRSALAEGQFELYFQPLIDGRSRNIIGAEALIRWNHPTRGMVSPAEFIPHAERTGLILPLGSWVMETACDHLAAWAERSEMSQLVLSINVSAKQFQAPDFARQMIAILDRTGANPHRLKIELTESLFAGNFDDIVAAMSMLQERGITFALDDFGTGFSSLSYLSRLPLDQLKIDRSFVAGIEAGDANVAICASIIGLARNLKLKVVAEGVETEAEAYFLAAVHRCDMLQGYMFSRPIQRLAFEGLFTDKAMNR
ncbi:MAG TPA: EAL domain-containing protein [Rhodospirillaceae bacterium]|nr:EAL domain-containing protein [Rhodospirillaceae bacterium]